jgi:hypothetical protein
MKLSYRDFTTGERQHVTATVTTDHADSSYGQPVIVLDSDNKALDITSWVLLNYQIEEASPDEAEMLERVLIVDPRLAAAAFGAIGGRSTSEAKAEAARRNANLPPKPGRRPRGRPRKDSK